MKKPLTNEEGEIREITMTERYSHLAPDNLRAAVNTAHWYDPDVNPTFVDFAVRRQRKRAWRAN